MHRFFIPPEECGGTSLVLSGREAKHAAQVLRLRPGDRVTVLNGAGDEFSCAIGEASRSKVKLNVLARKHHELPPFRITLIQALPKGKVIETIIQKATELGVTRIVPVMTERVITQLDEESASARAERWLQTAIEAVKQCGCPWLPSISAPTSFKTVIDSKQPEELALVAALDPNRKHVREVLEEYQRTRGRRPASVSLWVGPEGDFTPAELAAIRQSGAHAITLGRHVLRADTAAIAGLAILLNELDAPDE